MSPNWNSTRGMAAGTRPNGARAALIAAVAALAFAPGAARAATEPVKISAQTDRGTGRLVLEWRRPVTYTVMRTGDYVFVRFSQPLEGELTRARGALARYLSEMRLAGGGRVLVLRLSGEPGFAHQLRGQAIVLSWVATEPVRRPRPADNPTDSDPAPRLATPKPPETKPLETKPVEARRIEAKPQVATAPRSPSASGELLPKTPIVFRQDAPQRPAAAPAAPEQRFATPAPVAPLPKSPSSKSKEAFPARPAERPELPVVQPNSPSHRGGAPETPARGEQPAPARPIGPPVTAPERAPNLPQAGAPSAPPQAPRAEAAKPAPPLAKAPEAAPVKPEIRPAPAARPAPDGPIEPPVMPALSPTLTVASDGAETRIALAWPEPVAAAVFHYGDNVWMVFPRREPFDVQLAQRMLGPGVHRLIRIEHAQATILVARVRADMRARVIHERNVWTVVLKRELGAPQMPDVRLAISRGGAEQVAVPLSGAETPIRIVAPEIGSTLFIVPSRAVAAVAGERNFVTFKIVPAAQGALIEAVADGIDVGSESAAIMVRRKGGLLLSNGSTPASAQHGQ